MRSEVEIALSLLGLKAALTYLSMAGCVVIRLGPLLNELPVIGGARERPFGCRVECQASCWAFRRRRRSTSACAAAPLRCASGLRRRVWQVSKWSLSKRLLKQILGAVVTSTLLLPKACNESNGVQWQVIHIPLVDDEDVVDTAQLRDAKPLGVLRVVAAWTLGAEPCDDHVSHAPQPFSAMWALRMISRFLWLLVLVLGEDATEGPSDPEAESQCHLRFNNDAGSDGGSNLGACQGDCDDDSDCRPGLKCKQRDHQEDVPGCFGRAYPGWDYCYDPDCEADPGSPPLDSSFGRHGSQNMPACAGDCDDDADCAAGLACFQRDGMEPVPGCSGPLDLKE